MNAITCMTWMKKGLKEWAPKILQNDVISVKKPDDMEEEEEEDSETSRIIRDYGLDDYSDDDGDGPQKNSNTTTFAYSDLAYHTKDQKDPYMDGSEDEEEEEDLKIEADDNLLIVGKADKDIYSMEMWVYNEKIGNDSLYCHHDYILPSCPLTLEYVGGMDEGHIVAVGDFDFNIHLWDLCMVNCLDPVVTLEGCGGSKKKKKKKSENIPKGHTDAVLGLSWNQKQPHLLASCSADATVAVWDLTNHSIGCNFIGAERKDKVQDVEWHREECQTLLIGGADHTAQVFDCRSASTSIKTWSLGAEVEKVLWHTTQPFYFFAGLSNGHIVYVDIRLDKPLQVIPAHGDKMITDLTLLTGDYGGFKGGGCGNSCSGSNGGGCGNSGSGSNGGGSGGSGYGGVLVSGSDDGSIKVWSVGGGSAGDDGLGRGGVITFVGEKELKGGEVYCVGACPDAVGPLVAVGAETEVKVMNLRKIGGFCEVFGASIEGGKIGESEDEDEKMKNDLISKKKKISKNVKIKADGKKIKVKNEEKNMKIYIEKNGKDCGVGEEKKDLISKKKIKNKNLQIKNEKKKIKMKTVENNINIEESGCDGGGGHNGDEAEKKTDLNLKKKEKLKIKTEKKKKEKVKNKILKQAKKKINEKL